MKQSLPRTFSSIRTEISPSAKRPRLTRVNGTPRLSATASASGRFAPPDISFSPRLGTANPSIEGEGSVVGAGRSTVASVIQPVRECKVAPGGFEPPFSDPKTDVLPLDEGAGR